MTTAWSPPTGSRRRGRPVTALAGGVALALAACAGGPPQPARIDTRNDACAFCRMTISDPSLAAQLLAPYEEPRVFDDLGCLREYLQSAGALAPGTTAWVADHRTREWVRASAAVYTRHPAVATPMASHLMAHASATSRDLDGAARDGQSVPATDVFGPAGPPDAR